MSPTWAAGSSCSVRRTALAWAGSENSFGLGGYYKTPVEDVLPLVSRFEKEKEKPSLAMVLVIDKSGSMQGMPIQLARQAAKAAVELLGARDSIAIVGFDGQPQVICEMTKSIRCKPRSIRLLREEAPICTRPWSSPKKC